MKKLLSTFSLRHQNSCHGKEPEIYEEHERERKYKIWEILLIYTCLSLSILLLAMLYYSHH